MPPKQKKPLVPPLSIIYRKIAISFVVLTVLLVGIIVFFSLAQATVTVTPKQELKSAEFLVTVLDSATLRSNNTISPSSAVEKATIAGKYQEKTVEEEGQFEATGVSEAAGHTVGKVTLVNTTSAPQPLVATTRLLSESGVLFRMNKGATVPAKGSVEVEVHADKPGAGGDVGSSKFTIPGLNATKQKLIYGENSVAMGGGAQKVRVVTGDDLEKAKSEVIEKATKQIKDEFDKSPEAALGGTVVSSQLGAMSIDAKKGDARQTFTVKVTIKAQLLAYDASALDALALAKVKENIPADRELVKFNNDTMVIRIKNVNKEMGEVQLSVYADASVRLSSTSPLLDPVKIAGMLPEEASQYLKSFDAVEEVQVSLFPSWQKRIPTIPDRIKMVVKK